MLLDAKTIELTNHSGNHNFVADVKIDNNLNVKIENAQIQSIRFIQDALSRAEDCGIFPDECYYKLRVTEENHICNSDWILITGIQPQLDGRISYSAKISKFEIITDGIESRDMTVVINLPFEEIIPLLGYLGPHFQTRNFGTIDIRRGPEGKFSTIKCTPIGTMSYPEVRLTELLRFCTGSDINWINGKHGSRLFYQRPSEPLFKERHISVFPLDQPAAIYMFDALADYLLPTSDSSYSPTLDSVVNVCQSQKNILNYRLVVGATVEYLTKKFYSNIAYANDYIQKIDESVQKIANSDIDDGLKTKLQSALDNYKKVPPKKILNLMKASGIIDKHHIAAYESIRNSGAHGDDLKITEINNLFLKANAVLDLIFRIILNGIKFDGLYYSPIERENAYFTHKTLQSLIVERNDNSPNGATR